MTAMNRAALYFGAVLFLSGCGGGGTTTPAPSTANEWTWMSGSNTLDADGVYGTQGITSTSNVPGAREYAVSWSDKSGNLWLFGGNKLFGDGGVFDDFNDLWEFSPASKAWTWISGSNAVNSLGVYGTEGTASANNIPRGRMSAVSWIDGSGNLWLFGGDGYDTTGNLGNLNDLWEFSPVNKEWTWVAGSNALNAPGVYGTKGTASAANVPGARDETVSWIDNSGNLWLLGGNSSQIISGGTFSDLWKFSLTSKEWTWVSGSDTGNAAAVYGTQGTASTTNAPGARWGVVSWIDSSGKLWLFGGDGIGAINGPGDLNDLWLYQP